MAKKIISPRIYPETAEFLADIFGNANAGAQYLCESFQALYNSTMYELRKSFTRGELSLIIDVLNTSMLFPQKAGQHISADADDAISMRGYGTKWGVQKEVIVKKLSDLSTTQLSMIELWGKAYWRNHPGRSTQEDMDLWVDQLS